MKTTFVPLVTSVTSGATSSTGAPSGPTSPRVSVVLPVRNGGSRLRHALASIQAQSETNWELIVVDDGSSDETPSILDDVRRDSRLRVFTTAPRGIVHALNLGLDHCRAPLIARMDADDETTPDRLQKQCDFLDRHPEVGLVSSLVTFGGSALAAGGYQRHVDWLNSVTTADEIRRRRFVESPIAHPAVMFRQRVWAEHGGYREGDFPEDYELWLRWLECGVTMAKVPEALLTWNDPPHRLSRTCPRYAVEAFYRLKAQYLARWLRAHLRSERSIWIWGAGRVTRKRARWLCEEGIEPCGWIDIDPQKFNRRHADRPVHPPDALRQAPRPFVLAYVGSRDARETIAGWLERNGFREEKDYLLCA